MREEFGLLVDGIEIAGEVHLPQDVSTPRPAVVISHGIPSGRPAPGDEGYRPLAQRLAGLGFIVVLFNFRGCGHSAGNIDLDGWCRDLTAIIDTLCGRSDVDATRINLLGFSGGAAVSCVVAANDPRPAAIGLMACPAEFSFLFKQEELTEIISRAREIGSIRDADFPADPQQWLDRTYRVKPEAVIDKLSPRPVLLIHGTEDEVVPVEHGERLYALAQEPKELVLLQGAHHRLRQVPEALEMAALWLCGLNLEKEGVRCSKQD